MTNLRPLLEEGATDFEAAVLRLARTIQPPPDGEARLLAALGIGTGLAATASAAKAASTMTGWGAAKTLSLWALIGAASTAAIVNGGPWIARSFAPRAPETVTEPKSPDAAPAPTERSVAPEPRHPKAQGPEAVSAPHAREGGAPGASPRASSGVPDSPARLQAEIALLDSARAALKAGDGLRALRILDDHDAEFVNGQLGEEARYARVQALLALGERSLAEKTAARFLAQHPESRLAKRAVALVGVGPGTGTR